MNTLKRGIEGTLAVFCPMLSIICTNTKAERQATTGAIAMKGTKAIGATLRFTQKMQKGTMQANG
jgi:hypothetical protein